MTIETVAEAILKNGVWILAVLVAVENIGIPGYPGGFTLPIIGGLCRLGLVDPLVGFLTALVASSLTMAAVYQVGLRGGGWATSKLEKNKKFAKAYQYLQELIEKYGCPAVLIARVIPFVRVFVSITAGLLGMNWRKYCVYSFWGNLIYTVAAMAVGYTATAVVT